MANDTLEMTLLFDFFGDLLTEKQREYFDYYYNDDLSLSEIAEIAGISRQGVRDVLLRARSLLCEYEEKTGVVKRFQELRGAISSLQKEAELLAEQTEGSARDTALRISDGLNKLKG